MSSDPFDLERSEAGLAEPTLPQGEGEGVGLAAGTPGILGLAWPAVLGNLGFFQECFDCRVII